jgi:glycerol-3-phosphate dehydrogenase
MLLTAAEKRKQLDFQIQRPRLLFFYFLKLLETESQVVETMFTDSGADHLDVLIIGAGVTGLLLAQGLKHVFESAQGE